MTDAVLFSVRDGLARITLNRPQHLNAIDAVMAHAWAAAAVEATERDDVGAILISGQGRAFCAGGDIEEMDQRMSSGADLSFLAGVVNRGIRALVHSTVPVVAAAHGTTAGGGLGILLCSDYAIVGENSKIGSLYANVGLTPDLSVSAQLAHAVGQRRALQLLLNDRLLSANEAREWGLVAEVVAPDAVQDRAHEVAQTWLSGALNAYGEAKRLVRSSSTRSFDEQLAEEARSIGAAFDSLAARTRIAAFLAPRS